ncbi:unnamed protein product [Aspergillus oryzae var. brunneus]|nr:unnamed protein product [Aspergillus oryzae]GMG43108.1 unnamed protein product [Aspergillus oryzae var. brunneus]
MKLEMKQKYKEHSSDAVVDRSALSPSARTTRSPLSVEARRAVRARSPAFTVLSGLSTSSVSSARSPTARAFPSVSTPPRSSSPSSTSTRTVSRSWSASERAVRLPRPSLLRGFCPGFKFMLQWR